MLPSRRWMLLALILTLAAGTSVGVVADRLVLNKEPAPPRSAARNDGTIWFPCDHTTAGEDLAWWDRPVETSPASNNRWRQRRLNKLRRELLLDDTQIGDLQQVLHAHGEAARQFWRGARDEYCGLRDALRDDVRSLLREEQVPLFEERLRRLDSKAREKSSSLKRGGNERRATKSRD